MTVGLPEQVSLVVACLLFKAFLFQAAMSMTARHSLQNTFDMLNAINLIIPYRSDLFQNFPNITMIPYNEDVPTEPHTGTESAVQAH